MSKHLAELCVLLVDDSYGELASRIFATLLYHGRLALLPLSHRSDLPPRYVRHALAVLIQHCLVHYSLSEDDGFVYYEANVRNAYSLVRSGKGAQLVEEQYGKGAADVVSLLQHHGFAGASEVLDDENAISSQHIGVKASTKLNGVNGHHHEELFVSEAPDVHSQRTEACEQLFADKFAVQLMNEDFMSGPDFQDMLERLVKNEEYGGEVKGTRQTAEFQAAVLKRKARFLDANTATVRQLEGNAHRLANGKRGRSAEPEEEEETSAGASEGHTSKKRRIDDGNGYQIGSAIAALSQKGQGSTQAEAQFSEPAFRVNRDKMDVSFRSQCLVNLSARSLGASTSQVYKTLLRRLERNIPRCHDEYAETNIDDADEGDDVGYDSDDERMMTVTTMEVEKYLDTSVDVQFILSEKPVKVKTEPGKKGEPNLPDDGREIETNGAGNNDEHGSLSRQKRIGLVEQHLRLLAEDSHRFIIRVSPQGQGTWRVDFQALSRAIMQFELENIFKSRFEPIALRIIRILHDKGKLDEKQLGQVGLIRQKDLRKTLTLMQEAGFVDTQEVPRDNTRQPSRTIYLWFYDQDRCRKLVLNDTYKSMSRLLQRARVEKEKVQAVIDKADRTDVKGQEDKYLSRAEQDALADWHEKEEKLLVQLSRQDDLVALLRDFLPMKS